MTDEAAGTEAAAGGSMTPGVDVAQHGAVSVITLQRPGCRNALDGPMAAALAQAFRAFDNDDQRRVAVLTGAGGNFCAGADLQAVASADSERMNRIDADGDGPMGPTRMRLSKPVIAAVSGYCVAGGLELACWCDLRVADASAVFGVFCRRFGVPLIDGGTVRLPRLIGHSHAMDMILTGRAVHAEEAGRIGLANRVVAEGAALDAARALADELAGFPQHCLRADRGSALQQWGLDETAAMAQEFEHGRATLDSGESVSGASRFRDGLGRHGRFDE